MQFQVDHRVGGTRVHYLPLRPGLGSKFIGLAMTFKGVTCLIS
jgi:hypothetical protein